jgi:hypothetical protein
LESISLLPVFQFVRGSLHYDNPLLLSGILSVDMPLQQTHVFSQYAVFLVFGPLRPSFS